MMGKECYIKCLHKSTAHVLRSAYCTNCVISIIFFTDINECTTGTHLCAADAECMNSNGSYSCTCKLGASF